jgi:flagellar motility protein MotE (MotC chaperone)
MSNNKQNKQALAKAAKAASVKSPVKPGPAAEKTAAAQPFALRFRLLPVVIFAAVLLLGVRVVDLWQVVASRNAPLPDVAATLAKDAQPMAAVGDGKTGAPLQPPGRLQLAQANTGTPAKEPAPPPAGGEKKPEGDPAGGDALSPINNEQLLKHYADRRAELEKTAKDVAMREALLSAAEKRIEQKLKEMEKVRTEIQNLLKMGDERQSQQLDSLVKIYETMKPKEAARIFEELEMPVLLDVIQKMKETKTAPILAAMDPMKAKQVTAALVERRILPAVPQ